MRYYTGSELPQFAFGQNMNWYNLIQPPTFPVSTVRICPHSHPRHVNRAICQEQRKLCDFWWFHVISRHILCHISYITLYLSICLCIYPSIFLSIYLSFYLFIYLYIHIFIYIFIYLFIVLFERDHFVHICTHTHHTTHTHIYLYIYMYTHSLNGLSKGYWYKTEVRLFFEWGSVLQRERAERPDCQHSPAFLPAADSGPSTRKVER